MHTYVQLEADSAVMRDGSAGASMPPHRAWCRSLKLTGVLPACFQVNQVRMSFHTGDYNFIIIDRI